MSEEVESEMSSWQLRSKQIGTAMETVLGELAWNEQLRVFMEELATLFKPRKTRAFVS